MNLTKGQIYTLNGKPGFEYRFTLMPRGQAQHWFFHVGGYFTSALRDNELTKFVTA